MWIRIKESELVIRQSSLPARVVLESNSVKGGEKLYQQGGAKLYH